MILSFFIWRYFRMVLEGVVGQEYGFKMNGRIEWGMIFDVALRV